MLWRSEGSREQRKENMENSVWMMRAERDWSVLQQAKRSDFHQSRLPAVCATDHCSVCFMEMLQVFIAEHDVKLLVCIEILVLNNGVIFEAIVCDL